MLGNATNAKVTAFTVSMVGVEGGAVLKLPPTPPIKIRIKLKITLQYHLHAFPFSFWSRSIAIRYALYQF